MSARRLSGFPLYEEKQTNDSLTTRRNQWQRSVSERINQKSQKANFKMWRRNGGKDKKRKWRGGLFLFFVVVLELFEKAAGLKEEE